LEGQTLREHEWLDYYDRFSTYFSFDKVRDGNHPRIREQTGARESVVLVHGLSDSPFFMQSIADHLFEKHGCNVYLPLLHCHGLVKPEGMDTVALEEWKHNVGFAVECAHRATPERVSIGGLSTGGALSFYHAMTNPLVNGRLMLFSAALGLLIKNSSLLGTLGSQLMRIRFLQRFLDDQGNKHALVGSHPYKYEYVDKDGALQLVRLISELNKLKKQYSSGHPFSLPVFAAHSEVDDTADIKKIRDLEKRTAPGQMQTFYIEASAGVTHAGLVLERAILADDGEVKTEANARYKEMIQRLDSFLT
jgi:pimeloyl-ACP methyl ester carboxylesterase